MLKDAFNILLPKVRLTFILCLQKLLQKVEVRCLGPFKAVL